MQAGVGLLVTDVMPIYMIIPRYSHNYAQFYQLLDSNLFTHCNTYDILRESTSETYGPRVSFSYICLRDLLSFAFLVRSIKPKIQKYFAALYFICDLFIQSITTFLPSHTNFQRRYPKGIDNLFNTSGCEWLLFVCRICLRGVAWFSYWFDNLDLITEGNTYRCCATSSLPLWGNTDVASSDITYVQLNMGSMSYYC